MNQTSSNSKSKFAVVFFSLVCALNAPARSADFSTYFDGANQGSMAELVGGLRAAGTRNEAPKAPTAEQPQPNTGNNELLHFWEDLKSDVFDDICKDVEIPIEAGFDIGQIAGVEGKFKRYMKQYPDNKIAVIDEVGVKLDAGHTFTDIFNVNGNSFNIGLSGGLEGKSVVVRKTNEDKYCKNLLKLADLRKVKTILPINEKRINEMGVNEIWKFPARLHMGISGGLGYPVQPWLTIGFSLGTSKEMKPSVTLFKMDAEHIRLRIRLDRITVKSAGASVGTSFDAGMIGLPEAENFLMKEIDKALVKEFNKYLALKFGLSTSRAKGQKILLEFVIDAKNPAQVAKLVDFLKGDLSIIKRLIEMGVRFNDFSSLDDTASGQEALNSVSQVAAEGLGLNSTFAGSNHFNSNSHASNLVLPIVLHREANAGQRYDRYQVSGSEQVLHVHNASKNTSVSNINVPFIGKIFKHNTNQNFYVVNYENGRGDISEAAVVYQRYEGYIKHDESDARGMVTDMNEILKYAGTQGNGINSQFMIDVNTLFPRLDPANSTEVDEWGQPVLNTKSYKSALMSFSLVFTKEAVRDIVAAPAVTIMKAVLNVMEGLDREILQKVQHLFKIDTEGKVDYDWKAARKLLASYQRDGSDSFDPLSVVNSFCTNAARIIADIASVREIGDQKAKAKRLSEVLAGKGKSRVGYENMMQVMIQLVNVKDIFAKLDLKTDKRIKNEENIANSYNVYNDNLQAGYNSQLGAANSLRDRFSDPSVLSD
ncbi:MAG TPA: hypothetical protein DEQ38_09170 [Elusimicrobia bacterium]|nr:MAG: hypothetical protein A2089_01460 [Elusimicrobia bacterium GWD2_63_28]HCC48265.1 hypothetical protein [Elusimicrobiota bacterium]